MSTMAPAEQEGGYFPHWKETTGGVIMPEERLPCGTDYNLRPPAQRGDGRRNNYRAADHGL
jgi:hypothetical protein